MVHTKGRPTHFHVELFLYLLNLSRKAQRGYQNFLGFFDVFQFLFQSLPAHTPAFVLMTERGKERLQSPPFDRRKEVKM